MLGKQAVELRRLSDALHGDFSRKGPYQKQVVKLKKRTNRLIYDLRDAIDTGTKAEAPPASGKKKEAKTTASEATKHTKALSDLIHIKNVSPGLEPVSQIVAFHALMKSAQVAYKRWKASQP